MIDDHWEWVVEVSVSPYVARLQVFWKRKIRRKRIIVEWTIL